MRLSEKLPAFVDDPKNSVFGEGSIFSINGFAWQLSTAENMEISTLLKEGLSGRRAILIIDQAFPREAYLP